MNKRNVLIALGLTSLGALAGFGVKALASGIPSPNPLYYSGTLTEAGSLVNGIRAITVNLWPDGTTMGSPLCTTVASTSAVVNGRFRVALATTCKGIINQNNGVYVEVIDGATSLGRSPIGAVPYAVEADHAVNADNATNATNATTAATANAAGGTLATALSTMQSQLTTAPTVLEQVSSTSQTGVYQTDVVYAAISISLTPGTWLVEGSADLYTTGSPDGVQLGLYNATAAADFTDARGAFCNEAVVSVSVPVTVSKVVTVASNTTVQLKGYRNGASALSFGTPPPPGVLSLSGFNRLFAVQLL